MKNFGFTIIELLVALVIIGIAATIIAPNIVAIKPDKSKVQVLKFYNTLDETIDSLLESSEIYYCPDIYDKKQGIMVAQETNLNCTDMPLDYRYQTASTPTRFKGESKFANLLADALLGTVTSTDNTKEQYVIELNKSNTKLNIGRVSKDFITYEPNNINSNLLQQAHYMLEYCPDKDNCSSYDNSDGVYSNAETRPNKFLFIITKYGDIIPSDPMSIAYIQNPKNLNDRTADLETASAILKKGASTITITP